MAGGKPVILLDTCGLLALQEGGQELSPETRAQLEAPGVRVFVSAITALEIGLKHAAGKLQLPLAPQDWFEAMLSHYRVEETPVTAVIAFAASALPPIHKDPFDRIIIATAQIHGCALLTSDRIIPTYPKVRVIW
jgi:PIN domain nuclease of toxin-antitoxin system